jgi:hypothetical protein
VDIAGAEPERPTLQVRHLAGDVIAGHVELDDPHDFLLACVRPMIMLRIIEDIGRVSKFYSLTKPDNTANAVRGAAAVLVGEKVTIGFLCPIA